VTSFLVKFMKSIANSVSDRWRRGDGNLGEVVVEVKNSVRWW
jgi:hypothetical protein